MAATLLLADDSITIQRVIELTFADEHIRVIAAADGQQAIQRIDQAPPDIILADVGMPKVDGYGVATYVKQNAALKHIPVLLLTGAFEPIDEVKARATGCDGVLVKPFEPEKLIARVKELLAGSRHADLWPEDLPRVDVPSTPAPVARPVTATPPAAPSPALLAPPPPMPIAVVARPTEVVTVKAPVAPPKPSPSPAPRPMPPVPAARPAAQAAGPVFLDTPNHPMPRPSAAPRQQPPRAPEMPPPADAFESELDMLDVALSRLEPTATPHELDAATASDFARDLAALRNVGPDDVIGQERPEESAPSFGSWDLSPGRRPAPAEPIMDLGIDLDEHEPIDVIPVEVPAPVVPQSAAPVPALAAEPEPAVILPPVVTATPMPSAEPTAPLTAAAAPGTTGVSAPPPTPATKVARPVVAPPPPVPQSKPTLAGAFSALLAAERAQPAVAAPPAALSEAAIEDVVRRVLARMTDEAVHKVVLDAAERIIREEIEHLKASDNAKPR